MFPYRQQICEVKYDFLSFFLSALGILSVSSIRGETTLYDNEDDDDDENDGGGGSGGGGICVTRHRILILFQLLYERKNGKSTWSAKENKTLPLPQKYICRYHSVAPHYRWRNAETPFMCDLLFPRSRRTSRISEIIIRTLDFAHNSGLPGTLGKHIDPIPSAISRRGHTGSSRAVNSFYASRKLRPGVIYAPADA